MASNNNELKFDATNSKCKTCGSNLVFDPSSQMLKCFACSNTYGFPKIQKNFKHSFSDVDQDNSEWVQSTKVIKCKTCGAQVELNGYTITEACPYCGSVYTLEAEDIQGLKPDCVVPFKFDYEEGMNTFIRNVKKKFYVSSKFKKHLPKNKVRGIYVPTFTYDTDTNSSYKGTLRYETRTRDSKGNVHVHVHYKPISGTIAENFRDVTIEASSQVTDKEMSAITPYDYNDSYVYDTGFIQGYNAEHYQDDMTTCYNVAVRKMDYQIERDIKSKYSGKGTLENLQVSTNYFNKLYAYRLLPIYVFEFEKAKNKGIFTVMMNGQTGKVGRGLPKSALKISLTVFLVLAIIVGIIILAGLN